MGALSEVELLVLAPSEDFDIGRNRRGTVVRWIVGLVGAADGTVDVAPVLEAVCSLPVDYSGEEDQECEAQRDESGERLHCWISGPGRVGIAVLRRVESSAVLLNSDGVRKSGREMKPQESLRRVVIES